MNFSGPQFQPTVKVKIGGYGRYRRVPCETTSGGPEVVDLVQMSATSALKLSSAQVFQYCKVDPTCVQGTEQYHKAKCDVRFLDLSGKSHLGCSKTPTPSVNNSPTLNNHFNLLYFFSVF